MPVEFMVLVTASLVAVCAMRFLPKPFGPTIVALLTAAILVFLSWESALWLFLGGVLTLVLMSAGEYFERQTQVFVSAILMHVVSLVLLRDLLGYAWIGGAYFTLRHIHVLSDWWIGSLVRPKWSDYARYHLFLPVIAAGPIHRFEPFQRQLARRRNDPTELINGSERLLVGLFQFTVLGTIMSKQSAYKDTAMLSPFFQNWLQSLLDWGGLYLTFAGLSSIAIGLSLMMGLKIEENFNAPWRAQNLVEFWSRWHMSLTNFSKDYIFHPVAAKIRSSVAGAFAAMIFLGLWHGSSIYWLGWGIWQGLGVLVTVQAQRNSFGQKYPKWAGKIFIALWLSATFPVVTMLTGGFPK